MGKDPAFLFYADQYLGGTMGFTFEQHGAYLLMLLYQFNHGPFSDDTAVRIAKDVWPTINHKFKKDPKTGLWSNRKMQEVVTKRKEYSKFQRQKALIRWGQNGKPLSNKKINTMHMHCISNADAMQMDMPNGCMRVRNKDKGGKGGRKKSDSESTRRIEELYSLYPRKKKRVDALRAIRKALKKESFELLKQAVEKYTQSVAGKDPQYIPYPATWFNGECWKDEPDSTDTNTPDEPGDGYWPEGANF